MSKVPVLTYKKSTKADYVLCSLYSLMFFFFLLAASSQVCVAVIINIHVHKYNEGNATCHLCLKPAIKRVNYYF